jgi:hypothetical protein
MKIVLKKLLLCITVLFAALLATAQSGSSPFTSDVPFVYLGIDFTQVRVVNDYSATAGDIKGRQFAGINQLMLSEQKKFDWQKALSKTNFSTDISLVMAQNEKTDESKIMSTNTADETRLKAEDIEKLVKQYNFAGKKGFGMIVFMEALSKTHENGTMWVTFINLETKKVVLTERMIGKAQGFGFRNYYSYTVYKVIQEVKKNKFDEWVKK